MREEKRERHILSLFFTFAELRDDRITTLFSSRSYRKTTIEQKKKGDERRKEKTPPRCKSFPQQRGRVTAGEQHNTQTECKRQKERVKSQRRKEVGANGFLRQTTTTQRNYKQLQQGEEEEEQQQQTKHKQERWETSHRLSRSLPSRPLRCASLRLTVSSLDLRLSRQW